MLTQEEKKKLLDEWINVPPNEFNSCDADSAKIEPVDIITFGSPCQNLSLAGKRRPACGHDQER